MDTQPTAFHNPAVRSSGKVRRNSAPVGEARAAACHIAKCLALPITFRNLYVIELAVKTEVDLSAVPFSEAAATIIAEAHAARRMGVFVNYFWFEDGGWRFHKLTFKERDEQRTREKARYY